jgi:hypothetical protein
MGKIVFLSLSREGHIQSSEYKIHLQFIRFSFLSEVFLSFKLLKKNTIEETLRTLIGHNITSHHHYHHYYYYYYYHHHYHYLCGSSHTLFHTRTKTVFKLSVYSTFNWTLSILFMFQFNHQTTLFCILWEMWGSHTEVMAIFNYWLCWELLRQYSECKHYKEEFVICKKKWYIFRVIYISAHVTDSSF